MSFDDYEKALRKKYGGAQNNDVDSNQSSNVNNSSKTQVTGGFDVYFQEQQEKWKETQRQLEIERQRLEEQRQREEAERITKEQEKKKQEEVQKEQEQKKMYNSNDSSYQPGYLFKSVVEDKENNDDKNKVKNPFDTSLEKDGESKAQRLGNGIQTTVDGVADLEYKAIEDVTAIIDNILLGGVRGIKKVGDFAMHAGDANVRANENWNQHIQNDFKKIRNDVPEDYSLADDIIPEDSPIRMLSDTANDFRENLKEQSKKIDNDIDSKISENILSTNSSLSKKIAEVAPSVGQMIPGMAGGGATYMYASAAGSYYDDAIERGMNEDEAIIYANIMGGVESATESIQLGKVFKVGSKVSSGAVKSALKDVGLNVADNFIQEAVTEPLSEYAAQDVGGKDVANWSDMGNRMLKAGIDGALVAVIVDGATAGVSSAKQVKTKIENNETVTQAELKQVVEDVQASGKVDVETIIKDEIQHQIDKENSIEVEREQEDTQQNDKKIDSSIALHENQTPGLNTSEMDNGTNPSENIQQNIEKINLETVQNDNERINSLEKEIAPEKSGLTTEEQQEKMMFDMYVQEKGYDSMDEDSKKRYDYLNSQVEENNANVLEDNTEVTSPLEDRNINNVGNRSVKAYEYINPEVKPFFQREADNMLGDLRDTIPAERYKVGNDDGYNSSRWEGTPRATVKAIAELKDDFGYTYEQIKNGLEAIKEDHGAENNAVSKRIEFKLDERLREGYTTIEGYKIPPNQEYINFLQEKEIYDYNKEAFDSLIDEDYIETSNMDTRKEQPDIIKNDELPEEKLQKLTRKAVRENIIKKWGITTDELSVGKDITNVNYQLTDPVRVNEKVFGQKVGQRINDLTINQTKHNTAEKIRWQNQERKEIKDLGIKARSKESAAVQKYGEKQFVDKHGDVHEYGDRELAIEFPDTKKQEQIKKAAEFIRNKYDTYIDQINNVITALGYDEIPKRDDYMKHFAELGDIFSQTGVPFNLNDMSAEDLPTDINGLTEFNKPGKNWFASAQQRYGLKTTYDAITGIDSYLEGAGNLIYHTQDIQNYRALSTMIRDTYGQTKGFQNLEGLSDEQVARRIEEIQSNKLSRYAAWLDEQANSLAGKKGAIDRGVERALGRKAYTFFNTLKSQVGSNMTGFNVRSSLTNLISSTIAAAKTNKIAMVKGTISTVQNMFKNDGFIDKSDFLTARFGSDSLSSKLWSKISNAGQVFMTGTDYFTSNLITRSKYYEGLQKGMNDSEAIRYADDFGARVMGDRSQGSTAEIFNSKTLGLFTQFQLEVNNQWQYMVHDTKMDFQKNSEVNNGLKAGATALFQLGQLAAYSYFFNEAFEKLTGSRAAFDPVEIVKKIFGLDDDDDKKPIDERLSEAGAILADNLPFANLFTGGGRIPISEALNGVQTLAKKMTNQKNKYGQEITWDDVGKDMLEALPYYVAPTGYSQIKKTSNGLGMYNDNLPVHGSYTDSGNLRYTVEDDVGSKVKAGLFGAYANEFAQDYIDSGYKSIDKDHIQELKDLEMNSTEYRNYREGLSGLTKNSEKIDYVSSLDVSNTRKNIMANNIIKSDKFKVDMSKYDAFNTYDEFIFSYKYPGKYHFLKENNISYKQYQSNKDAYNHAIENPDDYTLSKAITDDYEQYYKYTKDIAKIDAKDSTGKTVSGLRKQRTVSYINKLNLSVGQKAILLRKYYKTDSTYNNQIIEQILKQNLTKKEQQSVLKSLNMTLNSDGTVSWKK